MSLGWIEAALRYAGRFSVREKAAYQEIFEVSEATVSRRQARAANIIQDACGGYVFERNNARRLVRRQLQLKNDVVMPRAHIFHRVPSMERWLVDTLRENHYGSFEIARSSPDPYVLRILIRAIQDRPAPARRRHRAPWDRSSGTPLRTCRATGWRA